MEWVNNATFATLAGASGVVAVIVAILKKVFGIEGRSTQWIASGLSLVVAIIVFKPHTLESGVLAVFNAVLILGGAVLGDNIVNYKKPC